MKLFGENNGIYTICLGDSVIDNERKFTIMTENDLRKALKYIVLNTNR